MKRSKPKINKVIFSKERAVIVIDASERRKQERRKYLTKCKKVESTSETLRTFENMELPAYARWLEYTFAQPLAELRSKVAKVHELESLVDLVSDYAIIKDISEREAYLAFKEAKAAGIELDMSEAEDEFSDDEFDEDEFDQDQFEDIVKDFAKSFGLDDDNEDEFFSREDPFSRSASPSKSKVEAGGDTSASYVKTLYYKLVMRLHPDKNPQQSAAQRSLWDQVQDAYAWQDLQRLESLLKAVDGGSEQVLDFKTMPISHIISMSRDAQRRLSKLMEKLRHARQHPGFGFLKAQKDKAQLRKYEQETKSYLYRDLGEIDHAIEDFNKKIANWERPPRQKSKKRKKTQQRQQPMGFHDALFDAFWD